MSLPWLAKSPVIVKRGEAGLKEHTPAEATDAVERAVSRGFRYTRPR